MVTSALLTANAGSGSADQRRLDAAVAVLRQRWVVDVAVVEGEEDLNRALDQRGERLLMVAGGDGTLHHTVAALHRRGELGEAVLGLLPLGTGNDFARQAEIPLDVEEAARVLLDSSEQSIDLIVDDAGTVVVNNVHLGVGAEASRRGAAWKERLGRIGYGLGMVAAAFSPAFRLDVEIDGEPVTDGSRSVLEVSVGNGSTVGGGLPLNPGAEPTDGELDVIVAYAAGPWRRVSYGIDLFRARHPHRTDVLRRSCDAITVAGQPFHLSADGEILGPVSRRSWHIERAALRMLLPR